MARSDWGFITPAEASKVISFERIVSLRSPQWRYSSKEESKSMFDIQAEGTARIWNHLDADHIAFLADEVGMGKTIQALAVFALLWRIEPDARVMVIAPNHSVAENWVNEYKTFINSHLRDSDNLVRTGIGQHAVHEPFICGNLNALKEIIDSKWCHFVIAKTSSLSIYSSSPDENWDVKMRSAYESGKELNRYIIESMKKNFDLLSKSQVNFP